MNYIKTITQKGQLLIPKEIREFLGIDLNDQVQIVIENGKVVLKKPVKDLKEFAGIVKVKDSKSESNYEYSNIRIDPDFFNVNNDQDEITANSNNVLTSELVDKKPISKEDNKLVIDNNNAIDKQELTELTADTSNNNVEFNKKTLSNQESIKSEDEPIVLSKNSKQVDLTSSSNTGFKI